MERSEPVEYSAHCNHPAQEQSNSPPLVVEEELDQAHAQHQCLCITSVATESSIYKDLANSTLWRNASLQQEAGGSIDSIFPILWGTSSSADNICTDMGIRSFVRLRPQRAEDRVDFNSSKRYHWCATVLFVQNFNWNFQGRGLLPVPNQCIHSLGYHICLKIQQCKPGTVVLHWVR